MNWVIEWHLRDQKQHLSNRHTGILFLSKEIFNRRLGKILCMWQVWSHLGYLHIHLDTPPYHATRTRCRCLIQRGLLSSEGSHLIQPLTEQLLSNCTFNWCYSYYYDSYGLHEESAWWNSWEEALATGTLKFFQRYDYIMILILCGLLCGLPCYGLYCTRVHKKGEAIPVRLDDLSGSEVLCNV